MAELKLLAGEPVSSESPKAIQACNDWLRLGPGRKLTLLLARYTKTHRNTPPTTSLDTLKDWSADYKWAERSKEYDAQVEELKNLQRAQEMEDGLALDFERVRSLKRMGRFLIRMLYKRNEKGEYEAVWVPDVKQIGSGEDATQVDLVRFNPAIFDQIRGVFDDLAKETGGRKKKIDLTSGDEPIKFITLIPPEPPTEGNE